MLSGEAGHTRGANRPLRANEQAPFNGGRAGRPSRGGPASVAAPGGGRALSNGALGSVGREAAAQHPSDVKGFCPRSRRR
eukprot:12179678-Alexandrium_andersonii.AAC.1